MRTALFAFFAALLVLSACKKTEPYENPVFNCNCGTIKWNNVEYPLLMAEYVRSIPDDMFSRRYYLTADIRLEGEVAPHNLNIQIGIDSVVSTSHFIPEFDVFTLFEEVNQNDELTPYRSYSATQGFVNVTAAFLGGVEKVNYQMILKEVVNGQQVGFDISVAGDFNVMIE